MGPFGDHTFKSSWRFFIKTPITFYFFRLTFKIKINPFKKSRSRKEKIKPKKVKLFVEAFKLSIRPLYISFATIFTINLKALFIFLPITNPLLFTKAHATPSKSQETLLYSAQEKPKSTPLPSYSLKQTL